MLKLHSFLVPAIAVTVVACSARFTAHDSDGTTGGSTGEAGGSFNGSAGSSSVGEAGEQQVGGSGSAGTAPIAGAGGTLGTAGASTGAAAGAAGRNWGGGGWRSGSGGATAADCETLREEYQAAVEPARACDKGSSDQCSPSSSAQPIGGCGCPVLINTKSEAASAAKIAYQRYLKAGCERSGPICDIFCGVPTGASCDQSTTSSAFVCTPSGLEK
jgi:hypothetical protein